MSQVFALFGEENEEKRFFEVQLPNPESLARKFADVLREWLTPEEFRDMQIENAKRHAMNPNENSCASHDYCDANMAMDSALREICPALEPVLDGSWAEDDSLCGLWNDAWESARTLYLDAKLSPEKIAKAKELIRAAQAYSSESDYGTESQIESENAAFRFVESELALTLADFETTKESHAERLDSLLQIVEQCED